MKKINPLLLNEKEETTLYFNVSGTTTSFVLSEAYTNYKYIEIYTSNGYGKINTEVRDRINISSFINSDTIYYSAVQLVFSGTNVTVNSNKSWYSSTVVPNGVLIYRVVGIK